MIDWVKSQLDPMISTNKKLRIKVAYDKNGYQTQCYLEILGNALISWSLTSSPIACLEPEYP